MSLVVICMALVILAMQGSWPTGTILIFALVTLFPAILVDLLVFIGVSNPRYGDRPIRRHDDEGGNSERNPKGDDFP